MSYGGPECRDFFQKTFQDLSQSMEVTLGRQRRRRLHYRNLQIHLQVPVTNVSPHLVKDNS